MANIWLRLYVEVLDDPKVQRLSGEVFKSLVNVWCLASRHDGVLPPIEDLAFALRIDLDSARTTIAELQSKGLLDDENGRLRPHNWGKRQYRSDSVDPTAPARMRRYRNHARTDAALGARPKLTTDVTDGVTGTVTLRSAESETDSESQTQQESLEIASLRSATKKPPQTESSQLTPIHTRGRGSRLPENWTPTEADRKVAEAEGLSSAQVDRQALRFRDYWLGVPGAKGRKADWPATWRNWCRREAEERNPPPPAKSSTNGASPPEKKSDPRDPVIAAKMLDIARRDMVWHTPDWGPMPNTPGCLIPADLVLPDDGRGWAEWAKVHGGG